MTIPVNATGDPSPRRRLLDLPPLWFLAAVCAMVALHRWLPVASVIPDSWRWLGYLPMLAALPLAGVGVQRFRRARTAIVPFGPVRALIRRWPYSQTRNPMYVALLALAAGLALRLGSFSPMLVPPLLWLALDRRFVRREEAFLRDRLGEAYVDYCARVRRWL